MKIPDDSGTMGSIYPICPPLLQADCIGIRHAQQEPYVTAGNLTTDSRVALILVDYPRQARLKILGHVKVVEGVEAKEWIDRLRDPEYDAAIERVFVIHVEAFDWNCQQHITPRFTEEQLRSVLAPAEKAMHDLEQENLRLKDELARLKAS